MSLYNDPQMCLLVIIMCLDMQTAECPHVQHSEDDIEKC